MRKLKILLFVSLASGIGFCFGYFVIGLVAEPHSIRLEDVPMIKLIVGLACSVGNLIFWGFIMAILNMDESSMLCMPTEDEMNNIKTSRDGK